MELATNGDKEIYLPNTLCPWIASSSDLGHNMAEQEQAIANAQYVVWVKRCVLEYRREWRKSSDTPSGSRD